MESLEFLLGIVLILIGIISLRFVISAKGKFPEESELKDITGRIVVVIVFLLCFSLWHTLRELFLWKSIYGPIVEIPEYFFISFSYVMIFILAKRLFNIATKFGVIE